MSTGKGGSGPDSTSTGEDVSVSVGSVGSSSSTGGGGCNSGAFEDKDLDGWTQVDGDCNDCDINVNPGAIEVETTTAPAVDEDCDGVIDNVAPLCDAALALSDVNPANAAKAIDLCQTTIENPATRMDRRWGVFSAQYIGADGLSPRTPSLQVGLLSKFGTNVTPRRGQSMLGMSTGVMRTPGQPGTCANIVSARSCTIPESVFNGVFTRPSVAQLHRDPDQHPRPGF